jgi:hypothetical protein
MPALPFQTADVKLVLAPVGFALQDPPILPASGPVALLGLPAQAVDAVEKLDVADRGFRDGSDLPAERPNLLRKIGSPYRAARNPTRTVARRAAAANDNDLLLMRRIPRPARRMIAMLRAEGHAINRKPRLIRKMGFARSGPVPENNLLQPPSGPKSKCLARNNKS